MLNEDFLIKNLGNDYYKELEKYYLNIFLNEEMTYSQIVFLNNSSLNLAEYFYKKNYDKIINPEELYSKFCTQSSILSKCNELAACITDGYMKKILIVRDLLIDFEINNFLVSLENKLINKSTKLTDNKFNLKENLNIIKKSIHISTFASCNISKLMHLDYFTRNTSFLGNINSNIYNKYLNIFSFLQSMGNSQINTFIINSKQSKDYININNKFKHFELYNNVVAGRIYFYNTNSKNYVATIRTILDNDENINISPFILLPSISKEDYVKLGETIKNKWDCNEISKLDFNTKNGLEAINLFLSMSLLKIFDPNLFSNPNFDDFKVKINYGWNNQYSTQEAIKLLEEGNCLFSEKELFNVLDNICDNSSPLLTEELTFEKNNYKPDSLILNKIEEIIYYARIDEIVKYPSKFEQLAFYSENNHTQNKTLSSFINDIYNNLPVNIKRNSYAEIISWLLLSIDTGDIELIFDEINNQQLIKTGDSSAVILPRKYYGHMSTYSYYAEKYGYDRNLLINKINELFMDMRAGDNKQFPDYESKIIDFLDNLKLSKQKPNDFELIRKLK